MSEFRFHGESLEFKKDRWFVLMDVAGSTRWPPKAIREDGQLSTQRPRWQGRAQDPKKDFLISLNLSHRATCTTRGDAHRRSAAFCAARTVTACQGSRAVQQGGYAQGDHGDETSRTHVLRLRHLHPTVNPSGLCRTSRQAWSWGLYELERTGSAGTLPVGSQPFPQPRAVKEKYL